MTVQIVNLQVPLNADLVIDLVDVPSFVGARAGIKIGTVTVVTTDVESVGEGDVRVTFSWASLQILDPGAGSWDCVIRRSDNTAEFIAYGTVAAVAGTAPIPPED